MQTSDKPNEIKFNKGKLTLIALLSVSILPIAAAYIMFFTGIGVPDNTVNAGTILPKAVNLSTLLDDQSDFARQLKTEKKWRLLIPLPAVCSSSCEQNFYTTRQVHIRLSEKSARVERVAVNIGGEQGQTYFDSIKAEHPNLKMLTLEKHQWVNWLAESGQSLDMSSEPYYLLLDQEGFAMMFYTEQQHGNELLKDIKRALKYSIDYQ
ncbi:hypothetical protein [Teredinibacter purpureus]|uniref:hypothetical protein n=1 Tax=Teredinibacter purpureus TaxID=2731756 RepID=UPI0005F84970|nr:hypothetical protein [Teredinibacter purpureus]